MSISFIETTFSCYPSFAEQIFGESRYIVRDAIVMASSYSSDHWARAIEGYQCYDIAKEVFCKGLPLLPTAFDYFTTITKMCSPAGSCATTDSCITIANAVLVNSTYNFFSYCTQTATLGLSEIAGYTAIGLGVGGVSYVCSTFIPRMVSQYLVTALPAVAPIDVAAGQSFANA
ncbi:MAG: hypothetical protein JSR37_02220 [Verrucomicrobia bacterium]|nr:hypothetical protein [Verrucomicrobiota bacterium]MBS0637462.1 hypothetical protein [Verrucomicrobiota bacterium]